MKQRRWLKAIALWQIAGGVIGAVTFLDRVPRVHASGDTKATALAIVLPICVLSVIAGVALLKGRKAARIPSMLVHSVQVLGIGSSELAFRLILGPYLMLYVTGSHVGINTGFIPQLQWHSSAPVPVEPHVIVNLLSLLCVVLLARWTYLTELVAETPPQGAVPAPAPSSEERPQGPWPPLNWP